MEKVLTDEELDALMKLCRSDTEPGSEETPAGEMLTVVEDDMHRHFFRMQQSLDATMNVDDKSFSVKVTNIGLGGMFLLSDIDLPVGKHVQMIVKLPKPEATIHIRSCVCWQKKVGDKIIGLGMRFPTLKTDYIWRILANMKHMQAYLESRARTNDRQLTLEFNK